jgi:hypothetical protein
MGGTGSGRKSVKGQAIQCLLGVQMDIQDIIYEKIDDPRVTKAEIKKDLIDSVKKIKVVQEEVEAI